MNKNFHVLIGSCVYGNQAGSQFVDKLGNISSEIMSGSTGIVFSVVLK